MKAKLRIAGTVAAFVLVIAPDFLEAQYGIRRRSRRRTAVVVSSANASQQAAASQQVAAAEQETAAAQAEAAAAQQEAAAAQQEAAAAEARADAAEQQAAAAGGQLPIGTVATTLPEGCTSRAVDGVEYYQCGPNTYRTAFQGNNLVYVTTSPPGG